MKFWILTILLSMSTIIHASEIDVKVSGMVCSMCAQGIKKKFSAVKSIKSIAVDLDSKTVRLETHQGQEIKDDQIIATIKEAGYNVANIQRK